ncbi:MAG TPA: tetratricopeptide repeat protein [Vampirovibrionales bacterium]
MSYQKKIYIYVLQQKLATRVRINRNELKILMLFFKSYRKIFVLFCTLVSSLCLFSCGKKDVSNLTTQEKIETSARNINESFQLRAKKDYKAGIAKADEAVELRPENPEAYLNRGLLYLEKGDKRKAKKDLKKAQSLYESANNNVGFQIASSALESIEK